jgi:long-chain acyl-CoA synthetase
MRVIGDLLRRTAFVYGDRLAVEDLAGKHVEPGFRQTWAQFNRSVNQLANGLLKLGIRPQDRVAVLSNSRWQFFVVYQALAKAGMVTVPINTAYKGAELTFLIANSGARALIYDVDLQGTVDEVRSTVPDVQYLIPIGPGPEAAGSFEQILFQGSPNEPAVRVDENDLLILLYTSGTTGRPKGAMLTHRNWVTSSYICTNEWRMFPYHRFLCVLAPFFTGAIAFMTFAVARGFSLVMCEFSPGQVLDIIQSRRITYSMFVPTMTNRLVNYPDVSRYDLSSLEMVITSGAPISEALVRQACHILFGGQLKFVFTYGTSETAVTGCQLQPEEVSLTGPDSRRLTSVGKAMLGMEVKVLDENGVEVAPGSDGAGEIVISGDSVGLGYRGMPENAELKDGTWYSGDLAKVDADGYIFIVDRKKDMILSGAANVYPREVEDVLHSHPAVMQAVVIGVPDPEWGERVHAVIVRREGAAVSEEELIAFCRERLASYKCPKSVEFIAYSDLPLSPMGKILKRELRERYWRGHDRRGAV